MFRRKKDRQREPLENRTSILRRLQNKHLRFLKNSPFILQYTQR